MLHETSASFFGDGDVRGAEISLESSILKPLAGRILRARKSFTVRGADLAQVRGLARKGEPKAGDLVLARVISIGHHTKLESPEGRRQTLYKGDEIIVAYGNRYAPDQFEAHVPKNLDECDLVAGGGIASQMLARHRRTRRPTRIQPIGLLTDASGQTINLMRFRQVGLGRANPNAACKIIVVVGTSMNAGKTTTAAKLIHGLTQAGLRVGAAKVTGTGSGGDLWCMVDAGARIAMDFTDCGHATTAGVPVDRLAADAIDLVSHISQQNDVAIVEVADGLFQEETAGLLKDRRFAAMVDHVILAAGDAMGAAFGHQWLKNHGLPITLIAGCVSSSPLGLRETESATGLKVATLAELSDGAVAPGFCFADLPAKSVA